MVFGMAHALTPGHGKAMVAAYLAGTRGTARHAFALGATVTITHTAGVFALGLVTLSLSQFILPETLYPWLNLASGVMVLAIGLYAFRDRLRRWLGGRVRPEDVEHGHGARRPRPRARRRPWARARRGTATRTTTATARRRRRPRPHPRRARPLARGAGRPLVALADRARHLRRAHPLPVGARRAALGHRAAPGGLRHGADRRVLLRPRRVVSGIGLTVIYARRLFQRLPADRGRFVAALPIASAAIITTLGAALTLRSLPGVL